MLNVAEVFHSIQGEGPGTGKPAVFLRLAGCNLRCTWCDTPHALSGKDGVKKSIKDVLDEIKQYECNHLVVTGGEPMIQQEGLKKVLSELDDFFVEIETNGGFESSIDEHIDQYNCSPKLKSSGNDEYELKILPNDKTWYKFVINEETDFFDSIDYMTKHDIPQDRALMMPQGSSAEECRRNSLWLVDKCIEHGYNFCPRLHIMLWDNERGK